MRVRLSASAPKGEPQPCIRQSPRAPASHGSAARRDAPGSRTASPGDRPIPRGSSSRRTTAAARNGHPPNRSCKLGSSSGRQTPWSLAPGSSLVPFPFLPVQRSVRLLLLPPFSFPEEARLLDSAAPTTLLRYQAPGTRRIHQMGYYWISPACSEVRGILLLRRWVNKLLKCCRAGKRGCVFGPDSGPIYTESEAGPP